MVNTHSNKVKNIYGKLRHYYAYNFILTDLIPNHNFQTHIKSFQKKARWKITSNESWMAKKKKRETYLSEKFSK
jgi:hypothetical protein